MRISDWSSDVCSSDLGKDRDEDFAIDFLDAVLAHRRRSGGKAEQVAVEGIDIGKVVDALLAIFGAQRELDVATGHREQRAIDVECKGRFAERGFADREIGRASCRERGCQYV